MKLEDKNELKNTHNDAFPARSDLANLFVVPLPRVVCAFVCV